MATLSEVPFYDPQPDSGGGVEPPSRILIVDGDAALRVRMKRVLAQDRRTFEHCGGFSDAISLLAQARYDLVILDYRLPDGNSLAILEWLQRHGRDDAVIMTGEDCPTEVALRTLRRGAQDFLRKPCHEVELRQSVRDVLQKHAAARTERRNRERLAASERLHRHLAERSPDMVFSLDADGCVRFTNPRLPTTLGVSRREISGRPFSALLGKADAERFDTMLKALRKEPVKDLVIEVQLLPTAGTDPEHGPEPVTVELRATPITAERDGRVDFDGLYCVARDLSAHRRAEELVGFQTYHDQLTHLPNRTLFKDRLELAIAQAQRRCNCLAVLIVDIDRFKLVNDGYGQADGDALLCEIATRFTAAVRSGDTVARLGGNEFAVLLTDIGGSEEAQRGARMLASALDEPFSLSGGPFRVTASIGISIFPGDGDTPELLTRHADIAMRAVKQAGKNGLRFFAPEFNSHHKARIALENDLRNALGLDQFELLFQPQISLSANRIVGMEALLRWNHPVNGLINPATFIPVAEEIGLIGQISRWVIDHACAQLARWRDAGHSEVRMSLNLAQHDFGREDIVDLVLDCLRKYSLAPSQLELEITESMAMQDRQGVAGRIRSLREAGVGIAIDDFGTGYSALAYLQELPVNVLKIDRRFVRDLDGLVTNPIVAAIAGIANGFGLKLIAEGVEHPRQAIHLKALGCDVMQGYYFAPPLRVADATRQLGERPRSPYEN
jgi:diguanylate cyclase (GGDEF)-like protein/PAS domain S-box-containing protein